MTFPVLISTIKRDIDEFLAAHELSVNALQHLIFHPGGIKLLRAYADVLDVPFERLAHSSAVLADFGNMAGATVYVRLGEERLICASE